MLANEFLAFEHSPLFFVDIIIHCSLLRTCRVRVEEKEEFLVYTVLWTLTCHPYLESATALSDRWFKPQLYPSDFAYQAFHNHNKRRAWGTRLNKTPSFHEDYYYKWFLYSSFLKTEWAEDSYGWQKSIVFLYATSCQYFSHSRCLIYDIRTTYPMNQNKYL